MFTHLHLHTEFSLLDGLSKIPTLMERARRLGQEAIAITDHGNLYGAIDFYREAKQADLHPILGMEAYVAARSHHDREAKDRTSSSHLTLLAQDNRGWNNLIALATKAHLDGFYYRPRMDRELLAAHSEGLIVLSGCASSELHKALQADQWEEARREAAWYREIFGDRYYLEVQEHYQPQFSPTIAKTVTLGHEMGIPLVATHDSHYCDPEDADVHEVLLCIGTNTTIDQPNRFNLDGADYYLTSDAEMRDRFPELPEVIANTARIAERCHVSLEFGRLRLPDPDVPPGTDAMSHLTDLARSGLEQRYGQPSPTHLERLHYELEVVRETGFAEYFLIVRDFAHFARSRDIAMGVRGSAAASIILYSLGITDIDPLRHDLVFERFLNVERREMPDIDMDFADNRRDEVIRYVADKYGRDRVAQIITFGTLGAKAALRDTGRALGLSFSETDRVARLVPSQLNITLGSALEQSSELRDLYQTDAAVHRLVDTARRLEGVARHAGTHAAGVVISREPLVENVPLQRPVRGSDDAIPMTQWAMNQCAEVGLLKMDFLGLSNLTILETAVQIIRETTGETVHYRDLPDGDPLTFAELSQGETFGVFQLESSGMRRYIRELKPTQLSDLAAMVALYRPGPMEHIPRYIAAKHGREPIQYPHPDLAESLDETYGVIVYQDQVLHIAGKFAGYTLGQADIMRKAMGKKIPEVMQKERGRFIEGARRLGYREADAVTVFDLMEPFAGYAFNKAHAVCYGTIAYQTAYLKAHYPVPYMTAVLRAAAGGHERVSLAAAECARLGIALLPPDINRSQATFGMERLDSGSLGIRFGLADVKNVGHGAIEGLLAERDRGGLYQSLEDLGRRADLRALNKRALESLIKAGALDPLVARGAALAGLDKILRLAQRESLLRDSGQTTMFDLFGERVDAPRPPLLLDEGAVSRAEQLQWEKELLGAYVSAHPFQQAAAALAPYVTVQAAEINEELDGQEIVLAGIVRVVRPLTTKKGATFCAAALEDLSGSVEVTVWPDRYAETRDLWRDGVILLVHARVRSRGERLTVAVERVLPYREAATGEATVADPTLWPLRAARAQPPDPVAGAAAPQAGESNLPSPAPAPAPPPSPRPRNGDAAPPTLHIHLQETEDPDADQARLHHVLRLVRETPGSFRTLLTVEGVGEQVILELPRCHATHALLMQLRAALEPNGDVTLEAAPLGALAG